MLCVLPEHWSTSDGAGTTEMEQHNAEGKAEKTKNWNQVLGKGERRIILLNSFF